MSQVPKRRLIIIALIVLDFCAIEFPGIILSGGRVEPRIFGLPFLYGYHVICWAFMTLVLLYAWRTAWGLRPLVFRGRRER